MHRQSRASSPKTQTRLREMLEILTRVEPWAGGLPQALGWYRGQSIPSLGDQTAEALVRTGDADLVRAYLDGFAVGGYAWDLRALPIAPTILADPGHPCREQEQKGMTAVSTVLERLLSISHSHGRPPSERQRRASHSTCRRSQSSAARSIATMWSI
jgi:hypothetical protein